MYNIEKFNIVDKGQYKSISYIEKLNGYPFVKMDAEYRLNLQTCNHLSNTIDIYLDSDQLKEALIDPITKILDNKTLIIETSIINYISQADIVYYKILRLLYSNHLINLLKYKGCNYQLKLKYRVEDDRYLIIESNIVFKSIIFKHKPREIQPAIIVLSMEEANNFLAILNCL